MKALPCRPDPGTSKVMRHRTNLSRLQLLTSRIQSRRRLLRFFDEPADDEQVNRRQTEGEEDDQQLSESNHSDRWRLDCLSRTTRGNSPTRWRKHPSTFRAQLPLYWRSLNAYCHPRACGGFSAAHDIRPAADLHRRIPYSRNRRICRTGFCGRGTDHPVCRGTHFQGGITSALRGRELVHFLARRRMGPRRGRGLESRALHQPLLRAKLRRGVR